MKKLVNSKIVFLLIAFALVSIRAGAQSYTVSPNGGTVTVNGVSVSTTSFSALQNTIASAAAGTITAYFTPGTYTLTSPLTLPTTGAGRNIVFDKYAGNANTDIVIFSGNNTNHQLINRNSSSASAANPFTCTFKNIIFENFTNSSINDAGTYRPESFARVFDPGTYSMISFDHVTIRNCNTNAPLFFSYSTGSRISVTNSSIINNNRSSNSLIHFTYTAVVGSGYSLFYNNTFSTNQTSAYAVNITGTSATYNRFLNNTFYNTGGIYIQNSSTNSFINNIVAGTSTYTLGGSSVIAYRNTQPYSGELYFNAIGNSDGTPILAAFNTQFNPDLSTSTGPGKQIHDMVPSSTYADVILGKGGTLSNLTSELNTNVNSILQYDQTGRLRPDQISIGAVDLQIFKIAATDKTLSSIYNSAGTPNTPESISCDLSQYIESYPSGINKNSTTFTITTSGLTNGTITDQIQPGSPIIIFNPATVANEASEFTVTVTAEDDYNLSHSKTFTIKTFVYDIALYQPPAVLPPGYIIPDPLGACFAEMGAVTFTRDYIFRTYLTNGTSERQSTFSIPLVADLNGDGIPEVIGFGISGDSQSHGGFRYIDVFNGVTGSKISRMPFVQPSGTAITSGFTHLGWHSAPAPGSLVDSDRNDIVEIIMAFPYAGGYSSYQNYLVSFNIVPSGSGNSTTYSLQYRWQSASTYNNNNTSNLHKVCPQICDLDGDGNPEVLVYNKIYDAVTGTLLKELETFSTAYMGLNLNAPNGEGYDSKLPFSYIYDMDLDGIYDIVAGGKIYKISVDDTKSTTSTERFSYQIIQCSGVGDGYTGVADITGDGVADVVVVNSGTTGTADTRDVIVTVWNPQFTGTGPALAWNPDIVAQQTIDVDDRTYGSNSYVYIGDIDGREDATDGKRRPEIAVLTGVINFGSSSLPVHPNVSGISTNGIPTSGTSASGGAGGCIVALTYDPSGASYTNKLKASFVLGHTDYSNNTGFTMFDFDNDGVNEICYRDQYYLRIIKPTIPYVQSSFTETTYPDVILLRTDCESETGFEYPAIADINNDASADMVVIGQTARGYYGYVYAVGTNGDKFAPTRKVWNQFIYDPFKINEDLKTPMGKAPNRLSADYTYTSLIKNAAGETVGKQENFNPYNGTLIQPAIYTLAVNNEYGHVYDPVVYLTEAYIADNNDLVENNRPILQSSSNSIFVTVGNWPNAKTAVSANTPIMVYKNTINKSSIVAKYELKDLYTVTGATTVTSSYASSAIQPGGSVRVRIQDPRINDADAVYWVRLADDSDVTANDVWRWGLNSEVDGNPDPSKGIGIARRQFRDCEWDDQVVKAARPNPFPDAATVQAYNTVSIRIFDNDILPDAFYTAGPIWGSIAAMNSAKIEDNPVAGNLTVTGSGQDLTIIYQNTRTDNLTLGVDSFTYQVRFRDESMATEALKDRTVETTVYIYVLQSETGFATCSPTLDVKLKVLPAGNVEFIWNQNDKYIYTGPNRTIEFKTAGGVPVTGAVDSVYMVEPRIEQAYSAANFRNVSFPEGELTVHKGTTGVTTTMKWTGTASTDWYNPGNWVEINSSGNEIPTIFTPTTCVDVIIPAGLTRYPELSAESFCNNITLGDRAMIAGIHWLTYADASVEIKLTSTEKDRFVMWSAPLLGMYSGDYHYNNASNVPQWGDVYMNLFQHANPAGGASSGANHFTATFGELGKALPLGTAFNLKVTSTTQNKDKSFKFPENNEDYYDAQDVNGNPARYPTAGIFDRTNGNKFITYISDQALLNSIKNSTAGDTTFQLTVSNDILGSNVMQVVNPYMAYLDMNTFLTKNSFSGYAVWDGNTNNGMTQVGAVGDGGNRYEVTTYPSYSNAGYVSPLQSFFVQKGGTGSISTVKMSPAWTSTTQGSPYQLRAASSTEKNILRIKATQGGKTSYAVIHNMASASPDYRASEDMHRVFYDEIGLEVYTLTTSNDALAINSTSGFSGTTIPLGLRLRDAGEVTLDFSRFSGFYHDAYLVDQTTGREINLQTTPAYTFTVAKSGSNFVEVNDRFYLRFNQNITGTDDMDGTTGLLVTSNNGNILVNASETISSLQVYTVTGALQYSSNKLSTEFKIAVDRQKTYFVKVKIGNEYHIEKVFVK